MARLSDSQRRYATYLTDAVEALGRVASYASSDQMGHDDFAREAEAFVKRLQEQQQANALPAPAPATR